MTRIQWLPLFLGLLAASPAPAADLVETAAEKFTTFVAALKAAGLTSTLKGPGPFTVFAPTNEAFAKLPQETQYFLVSPWSKAKLRTIYTYYVVPGKLTPEDISHLESLNTLANQKLTIRVENGSMTINQAHLTALDLEASNGIIYGIDSILLPRPVLQERPR
jgi:uncharacterized surface protein with fasciclin (FAS1) repeats